MKRRTEDKGYDVRILDYCLIIVAMLLICGCGGSDSGSDDDDDTDSFPTPILWYVDADSDGYSSGKRIFQEGRPGDDYFKAEELQSTGGDCNDADGKIHPGATESCANRMDDNCNGETDEGCLDTDLLFEICSGVSNGINTQSEAEGRIFILTSDGQKSNWNDNLPSELLPTEISQIDQVICLGEESSQRLETCEYIGTTKVISRYQFSQDTTRYSAIDGELQESATLVGTVPRNCPSITFGSFSPIYGSHISIYDLLENYDLGFRFDSISVDTISAGDIAVNGPNIYIADQNDQKIYRLDANGNLLSVSEEMDEEIQGLHHDGTNLWVVLGTYYPDACKLDDDFQPLECFHGYVLDENGLPESFRGLTGNDQKYWIINHRASPNWIQRFNNDWELEDYFTAPERDIVSIAHDGNYLWILSDEKIYKCDEDGNIIHTFLGPEGGKGLSIRDNILWVVSDLLENIYKIDLSVWTTGL